MKTLKQIISISTRGFLSYAILREEKNPLLHLLFKKKKNRFIQKNQIGVNISTICNQVTILSELFQLVHVH